MTHGILEVTWGIFGRSFTETVDECIAAGATISLLKTFGTSCNEEVVFLLYEGFRMSQGISD